MLTYQEGNMLYIQHQFLKDLVEEIRVNPDIDLIEFGKKLKCVTISSPQSCRLSGNLHFDCMNWFDLEQICFLFKGECVDIEANRLEFSARLRLCIQISTIERFRSSATNGYFPVKLDF